MQRGRRNVGGYPPRGAGTPVLKDDFFTDSDYSESDSQASTPRIKAYDLKSCASDVEMKDGKKVKKSDVLSKNQPKAPNAIELELLKEFAVDAKRAEPTTKSVAKSGEVSGTSSAVQQNVPQRVTQAEVDEATANFLEGELKYTLFNLRRMGAEDVAGVRARVHDQIAKMGNYFF